MTKHEERRTKHEERLNLTHVDFTITGDELWGRMNRAVEKIQKRLERTVATLASADIPFAVIGGLAVRAWVAQADEAAVRTTRDVDIMINRLDLPRAIVAMENAGFVYRVGKGIPMFMDGPDTKARDAVHILFANEKVRQSDFIPTPGLHETVAIDSIRTLNLDALVRMKLNVFRDKDKMHLRDMLDVELIDATWLTRLPQVLSERLKQLIDNPEDGLEGMLDEPTGS